MNIHEQVALFTEGEKYSEGEIHNIWKWHYYMRDTEDIPHLADNRKKVEKMMRAFIARKKQGILVTTRQLEIEFGCTDRKQ